MQTLLLYLLKDKIVSTATLKNPAKSYRNKVFKASGVSSEKELYNKELGYIVTHPEYENRKFCQMLLVEFMSVVKEHNIFATTRKPAMAYILTKFDFNKIGDRQT